MQPEAELDALLIGPNLTRNARFWLRLAAWSAGTILLMQVVRWPLVSLLTVFLEPMLEIVVSTAFLGVLTGCLVHAIIRHKRKQTPDWIPFAVCAIAALMVAIVPFNALYFKANFALLRARRTSVAVSVLSGKSGHAIRSGGRGDLIELDASDSFLSSDGGEVMVDHRGGKTFIIFFTFRGILDRFSGYVYSPTDDPPAKDQFLGDGIEIERVAPHWFWYAS